MRQLSKDVNYSLSSTFNTHIPVVSLLSFFCSDSAAWYYFCILCLCLVCLFCTFPYCVLVYFCVLPTYKWPSGPLALILINKNKIKFHCTATFQVVSEAYTMHLFTSAADCCNECDSAATKRRRQNAVVLWQLTFVVKG